MKTLKKLMENGLSNIPITGRDMGRVFIAHSTERALLRRGRAKAEDMTMIDDEEWEEAAMNLRENFYEANIYAHYEEMKNWLDRTNSMMEILQKNIREQVLTIQKENDSYLCILSTSLLILSNMPGLVVTQKLADKAQEEEDSIKDFSHRTKRPVAVIPDGGYTDGLTIVNDSYVELPRGIFDSLGKSWITDYEKHPERKENIIKAGGSILAQYKMLRAIKETYTSISHKLNIPELTMFDFGLDAVHKLMEELEEQRVLFHKGVNAMLSMNEKDRDTANRIYDEVYPDWVQILEDVPPITPVQKRKATNMITADLQGFQVYQDFEMLIQVFMP